MTAPTASTPASTAGQAEYHLYIANKNYSSWSLRPWLLLKHYAIPFEEHLHPFQGGYGGRQPQWKAFSPTATVPCLHHFPSLPSTSTFTSTSVAPNPPASDPIIVWDSLSIIDYISDLHPHLPIWPKLDGTRASLSRRAWARSATAEMHSPSFSVLRHEMYTNVGLRVTHSLSPTAQLQFSRLNELWTEGLTRFGGPFLCGKELGAVDAFYAPFVLRVQTYVGSVEGLGRESNGYVERMLELGEMREWVDAALGEEWREGDGEEDTLQGREVLGDLRLKRGEGEVVRIHY
ncbi:hypothetical protein GE09DRAFT_1282986 [Coniochaeta sp. 2T2.1]|nr:hypothetical protein GE09DRAFT_1282986 [Coniochaeta sp. 2T2.1]